MSFDPTTNGVGSSYHCHPQTTAPFSPRPFHLISDLNSSERIAKLKATLSKQLGPEYISQRPGPGGTKLSYIEGWKAINLANEIFGFDGWASSITSLTVDYIDHNPERQSFSIGVTAIVRVALRDGAFHEDVGYGTIENVKQKGAALDKCKKEAITDGVKRALRNFGNVLGNCLYDKSFANEIPKVPVPRGPKVVKSNLYRGPGFTELSQSETPKEESTIPAPTNNQAFSDAQHVPRAPANDVRHPPRQGPSVSPATSRRPEASTSNAAAPAHSRSSEIPRPPANLSTPAKPRSNFTANRVSSISRQAAIEAAMADDPDPPEHPVVLPQPPSPVVQAPGLGKSTTSFSSDDDLLYGDIDLNLECYDSIALMGDITLVNDSVSMSSNEENAVQPCQNSPPHEPAVQGLPFSSSKEPQSRLNPLNSRPSDSTSLGAPSVHPRNVFNTTMIGKSSSSGRPVAQEVVGKKRNSDEMNEVIKRTAPIPGGFTTAATRGLQPGNLAAERAFLPQNPTETGDGNNKRSRR